MGEKLSVCLKKAIIGEQGGWKINGVQFYQESATWASCMCVYVLRLEDQGALCLPRRSDRSEELCEESQTGAT